MKRVLLSILFVLGFAVSTQAQVASQRVIYTASNPPTACVAGKVYTNPALSPAKAWVGTSAGTCTEIDASTGASKALDNLASVNINTSLLAQTGVDLGSTTKPFRDLFLFGSGTYGTTYFRFTGAPTSTRTLTFQNRNGTIADDTDLATKLNLSGGTLVGDLLFTDGLYDIGKSGATRPRDFFASRNGVFGGTLNVTGNVGLGTTTPETWGKVAIRGFVNIGGVNTSLSSSDATNSTFDVRHSTGNVDLSAEGSAFTFTAGSATRLGIGTGGNLSITGGATFINVGTPAIAGNGTLNTGSKDSAGKITSTGTGASTVVLTFATAFTRAPACFVTNETTSNLVRPVSTTTTLTINATVVTGDSISYICLGY